MKTIDKSEILSRTSLFQNISAASRKALAGICIARNLRKKERLFNEGDTAQYLYVLVSGAVRLHKTSADGRDVVIKIVKPGEMFAEVILFEADRYPVSAVALKTSLVYQVPKREFNRLLDDKEFRTDFIRNLMLKLRYLADQIRYLSVHDTEERLFLFLQDQFGKGRRIVPGISKKDMASAIGATPETFSRLLSRLKNEGKLEWDGKEIVIPTGQT